MAIVMRRRSLSRLLAILTFAFLFRLLFFSSTSNNSSSKSLFASKASTSSYEIQRHNVFERATRSDKSLNVQRHKFLQARMGRDERADIFGQVIQNGLKDWWERFQLPRITNHDTAPMDAQHVVSSIDQLLSLNGWVAALCPTLTRPFGQNKRTDEDDAYSDLIRADHLYYIAIVIHSADHFLVDQLAVIVQMAKRLGSSNLFVSMLDYDSSDSTETLTDLCEAVLILLGVPFRIRRVPGMTSDPSAAYYPLEEAYMRNLVLDPLRELRERRGVVFNRVVWLKGFTCPNDILETIKVSFANEAAMVCGMDWAEHNGLFIFSDRWRTRDIEGDQFRQSQSTSKDLTTVPPRDTLGAQRFTSHLPFQVFCCEAGTHVVDPSQSYYKGITYRAGSDFHNLSKAEGMPVRAPEAACLDSAQAWFCRDLWVRSAKDGMDEEDRVRSGGRVMHRRDVEEVAAFDPLMEAAMKEKAMDKAPEKGMDVKDKDAEKEMEKRQRQAGQVQGKVQDPDPDANAGSDYDAMPVEDGGEDVPLPVGAPRLAIPNSDFMPARILVNPRCVTTYAGVSHTQLALDLFGDGEDQEQDGGVRKYVLDDWEGAPESFVCQEQKQTGGRKATKTQRRLGFSIYDELKR